MKNDLLKVYPIRERRRNRSFYKEKKTITSQKTQCRFTLSVKAQNTMQFKRHQGVAINHRKQRNGI